jgi:signal transduction histidine kinase
MVSLQCQITEGEDFNMLEGSEQQRTITIENWPNCISSIGWLSTSIVHDLRNPLGTVFAGAEMLMELDPAPTQVKRLAANIYRAAGRMRELLADITGPGCGSRSTSEICKIRNVITAASDVTLPAAEAQSVQILNDVPGDIEIPLERSRMEHVCFILITNALEAMPHGGKSELACGKRTIAC